MSQADLARILPLTTRQLRNLERVGLPHRAEGNRKWYPIPEAVVWWRDREVERALEGAVTTEFDELRIQKLRIETEGKELELRQRRDELVPMDEVESLLRESVESIDAVLQHSPARHAPTLAKLAKIPLKKARTILEDVVEAVRGSIPESRKSA